MRRNSGARYVLYGGVALVLSGLCSVVSVPSCRAHDADLYACGPLGNADDPTRAQMQDSLLARMEQRLEAARLACEEVQRNLQAGMDLRAKRCSASLAGFAAAVRQLRRPEVPAEADMALGHILAQDWRAARSALATRPAPATRSALVASGSDNDHLDRVLLRGYANLGVGDWEQAWLAFSALDGHAKLATLLPWAQAIVRQYPACPMTHLILGDVHLRMGQYDEALSAFDLASLLSPESQLSYDLRAMTFLLRGAPIQALAELADAPEGIPASPHTLFVEGMAHLLGGDFPSSCQGLTTLLDAEPDFFLARTARGVARLLQGEYALALEDFDRVARDHPAFVTAACNAHMTAMLRARGLFALDMAKVAELSAKGVLGSQSSQSNLYVAAAGINSPTGGDMFDLARQRARADARVLTIRETDYASIANDPDRLRTTLSTYVGMNARQAQAEGKDLIVSIIGADSYKSELASDYMFGGKRWNEATRFVAAAMDGSITGFRQSGAKGDAFLDMHSMGGDAFKHTRGPLFDEVNGFKIRTGGGLDDGFAQRCGDYRAEGKLVRVVTGAGDIPSLGNMATKSSVDRLVDAGLVEGFHDKLGHGHSAFLGPSIYEVRTSAGARDVLGDIKSLTSVADQCRNLCGPDPRSGVFLKLGSSEMDIAQSGHADLSFLLTAKDETSSAAPVCDEEPSLGYPFLIVNVTPDDVQASLGGESWRTDN